jgi:hypothetical protein
VPWKIYENGEGQHCVHKLNADDTQGELVACHATRSEAIAQQRALYASESKEITNATIDLLKEIAADGDEGKPERAAAVLDDWKMRIDSIPEDEDEQKAASETSEPENKEQEPAAEQKVKPVGKKDLLGKLKEIAEKVSAWFSGEDAAQETGGNDSGMSIWKEGNLYWWMARYSNNFRDQDSPPEIISSDSHRNFVRMVKEGKAPLPELWLFHRKEWKVGRAHGVAYDETGFAIAIGTFDADKGYVAEALMKSKDHVRVSHGMPFSSIERDPKDKSVITRHETREISPLPSWAAANKLTGFVVLNLESNKEESIMAIPDATKQEWVTSLGLDPRTLDSLEAANARDADKAKDEGLESKETDAASAQPATPAEVSVPEQSTAPAESAPAPVQDFSALRDAVTQAVSGLVAPMVERISALEASMKQLKEASDAQQELLKGTPNASMQSIIAGFAQSAIGAPETRVDGRTELAKSKPQAAPAPMDGRTPIPFINEILASGK